MTDLEQELFQLEQRLALVGQAISVDAANRLIADEYIEIGISGRIWRKAELVQAIASWPTIERTMEDFCVIEIASAVYLVTYKSRKTLQSATGSLRSSIWRLTNGNWQIVFHQGTKTAIAG